MNVYLSVCWCLVNSKNQIPTFHSRDFCAQLWKNPTRVPPQLEGSYVDKHWWSSVLPSAPFREYSLCLLLSPLVQGIQHKYSSLSFFICSYCYSHRGRTYALTCENLCSHTGWKNMSPWCSLLLFQGVDDKQCHNALIVCQNRLCWFLPTVILERGQRWLEQKSSCN